MKPEQRTKKPRRAGEQSLWQAIRAALARHYSAPLVVVFRQFRAGVIYFGVGLGTVLMANNHLTPSPGQELLILAGLVVTAIGFIIALLAETRLVISRIIQFLKKR